jgi:O-glycosyl hydrolase
MNFRSLFCVLAGFAAFVSVRAQPTAATLTINLAEKHQTMEGFGSCIVTWLPDYVASYQRPDFPDFYLNQLGASVLRIDLWGDSDRKERTRWEDISYQDFTFEGEGARGKVFVDVAKRLAQASEGRLRVIASVWSPPAWMKVNASMRNGHPQKQNFALDFEHPGELGLWNGPLENDANEERFRYVGQNKLRHDRYLHFAKLLVEWTRYFRALGIELYAISPQNEPRFSHWFESCDYSPAEYAELLRVIAWMFAHEGEKPPQIFGPEHMTYDVQGNRLYLDAIAAQPTAMAILGAIASHGYIDGYLMDKSPDSAAAFKNLAVPYGKKIWMTEGGTGEHEWPAPLHGIGVSFLNALVDGDASLMTPWQIYDRDPSENGLATLKGPTKKTRVAMQFWRFIRPGMVRVGTSGVAGSLGAAAFEDPNSDRIVVVVVNRTNQARRLAARLGNGATLTVQQLYVTDATRDCLEIDAKGAADIVVPAESVSTLLLNKPAGQKIDPKMPR